MSRIISYPYDDSIKAKDAWVGTDEASRQTKQYTAEALAEYLNISGSISIIGQMTYKYGTTPLNGIGTLAVFGGGPDIVAFSAVVKLTLSNQDISNQRVVEFLDLLVGSDILIAEQGAISTFGYYSIDSYAINATDSNYYDLGVTFKSGNGSMRSDRIYEAQNFVLANDATQSPWNTVPDGISYTAANVGIGTVTPSEKLEVSGGIIGDTLFVRNTDGYNAELLSNNLTTNRTFNFPDVGGTLALTTDITSSPWDTVTGGINYANGNVGIGTTSPSTKLEIYGNVGYTSGNAIFPRTKGIAADWYTSKYDGSLNIDNSVGSSGNTAFRIGYWGSGTFAPNIKLSAGGGNTSYFASGNVGIGTTNPTHKLTVNAPNDTTAVGIDFPSAHFDFSANSTSGYTSNFRLNDVGMDIGHDSTSRSLNLQTGNLDRVTILGNGNVGIGTTSPSSKLHVEGTLQVIEIDPIAVDPNGSRIIAAIDSRGGSDTGGLGIYTGDNNNDEAALLITNYLDTEKFRILGASGDIRSAGLIRSTAYGSGNVTGTAAYNLSVDSSGNVIETTAANLSNWTLTGNDIYNSNSGNVGIGTTNPGAKLDVDGPTYLRSVALDAISGYSGNNIQFTNAGNTTFNNSNVGIGTTSPNYKLDVAGEVRANNLFRTTDGTNIGLFGSSVFASNVIGVGSSNAVPLVLGTNATERMRITNTGNVGIGTTAPGEKLEVNGRIKLQTIAGSLILQELGAGSVELVSSATLGIVAPSNFRIKTGPSSIENFTVLSTGNVGIGTTSPGTKLHVGSGSGATVDTGYQMVIDSAGIAGLQILSATTQSGRIVFGDSGDNDIGMIKYDHTDNSMGFRTNGSGNERMRIDSTGNVGIGTTSPDSKLDVTGGDITVNTAGTGFMTFKYGAVGSETSRGGITTDGIDLKVNATAELLLLPSGNVGIGTTSPQRKLTIGGIGNTGDGLKIEDPTNTAYGAHLTYYDAGSQVWLGGITNNAYNDTLSMHRDATRTITVDINNNVGIGTTNPAQKLHVSNGKVLVDVTSSVGTELILQNLAVDQFAADKNYHEINFITSSTSSETTGGYVRIKAGQEVSGNDNRSYLGFWTAPDDGTVTEKMRITSGGNVGIGTTNPSEKLEVDGQVLSDGYRLAAMQTAPAARNSAGTLGEIVIDGNHIYVCYATDSWSRVALETSW